MMSAGESSLNGILDTGKVKREKKKKKSGMSAFTVVHATKPQKETFSRKKKKNTGRISRKVGQKETERPEHRSYVSL